MFDIVLRHYRRLGIFSFGMAALCLSLLTHSGTVLVSAGYLMFFVLCLLGFCFVALGLYHVKPSQRGILEIAGLSGIISTLVLIYLPHHEIFNILIGLAVFFGVITSTWFFLHSQLSYKIGSRTSWRARHSADLPFSAKQVWKHIVPGESPADEHCTGMVVNYELDPEDEDTISVTFKGNRGRTAEYELTFLEKEAPNFCRFYFQGTEACGTIVDGVFSLSIEVIDRWNCTIIANEERSGLSLGSLIERWFDDPLGFQHDRLLSFLQDRYGSGEINAKPMAQQSS